MVPRLIDVQTLALLVSLPFLFPVLSLVRNLTQLNPSEQVWTTVSAASGGRVYPHPGVHSGEGHWSPLRRS